MARMESQYILESSSRRYTFPLRWSKIENSFMWLLYQFWGIRGNLLDKNSTLSWLSFWIQFWSTLPGLKLACFCHYDCQCTWLDRESIRLLTSVDILLQCCAYVGTITSGPSVFLLKVRADDPCVTAIDCPQDMLPDCLTLNIDERAAISRRFVVRLT